VGLTYMDWSSFWTPWVATVACVALRLASLYFGWRLPVFHGIRAEPTQRHGGDAAKPTAKPTADTDSRRDAR
jgi:hypothetical protein